MNILRNIAEKNGIGSENVSSEQEIRVLFWFCVGRMVIVVVLNDI